VKDLKNEITLLEDLLIYNKEGEDSSDEENTV